MKIAAGMILGILIGAACGWFDVPVPSPPRLVGALLGRGDDGGLPCGRQTHRHEIYR